MSKGTDTRDVRAIAQIACPKCNAPAGQQCRYPTQEHNRPRCHIVRRRAQTRIDCDSRQEQKNNDDNRRTL